MKEKETISGTTVLLREIQKLKDEMRVLEARISKLELRQDPPNRFLSSPVQLRDEIDIDTIKKRF